MVAAAAADGEAAEPRQHQHPVFRVSFAPSSTGNATAHGTGSVGYPPPHQMAITVRELSREEVESQVLAGKKEPLRAGGSRGCGSGRIGFLPRWWVEAAEARRQRLERELAAEAARVGRAASPAAPAQATETRYVYRAQPHTPGFFFSFFLARERTHGVHKGAIVSRLVACNR